MQVGLTVTIFGMAVRIGIEAWRLWRTRQAMAGPALSRGFRA